MRELFDGRLRGLLLSVIGIVSVLWLAATGRLGLYIHPRYFVFTVTMAVIALAIVVAALAAPGSWRPMPGNGGAQNRENAGRRGPLGTPGADGGSDKPGGPDADPGVEQQDEGAPAAGRGRRPASPAAASAGMARPATASAGSRLAALLSASAVLASGIALLVLPPATLTSATASQRAMNSSIELTLSQEPIVLAAARYEDLDLRGWAGVLRQGADEATLAGRTFDAIGFVVASTADPGNVFYVSRFVVTCCAIDAQPVGVAVYLPGWQDSLAVDQWVHVTGGFIRNPAGGLDEPTLVSPTLVEPTDQPAQPYVS